MRITSACMDALKTALSISARCYVGAAAGRGTRKWPSLPTLTSVEVLSPMAAIRLAPRIRRPR
jgi:hypothetical protein